MPDERSRFLIQKSGGDPDSFSETVLQGDAFRLAAKEAAEKEIEILERGAWVKRRQAEIYEELKKKRGREARPLPHEGL